MSVINLGAFFGWKGSADTDLKFSEFFGANHTVVARVMPQYPIAFAGPILAENGSGMYIHADADRLDRGSARRDQSLRSFASRWGSPCLMGGFLVKTVIGDSTVPPLTTVQNWRPRCS
jgi:hypothetical protein